MCCPKAVELELFQVQLGALTLAPQRRRVSQKISRAQACMFIDIQCPEADSVSTVGSVTYPEV